MLSHTYHRPENIKNCLSAWIAGSLIVASLMLVAPEARAVETLVLQVNGSFPQRTWSQGPATAHYNVTIPCRGRFRGVVVASPALFGGIYNNSIYYHLSTQFRKFGDITLGNWSTTDIEVSPITTERWSVVEKGGIYRAEIVGVQRLNTWDEFDGGEAQDWAAEGYFDPSPIANAGPNLALESGTTGTLLGSGSDVHSDALTYSWIRLFGPGLNLSSTTAPQPIIHAPVVTQAETTRMQLIVSDGHSDSLPDTVDVVIYPVGGNIPPFVDPGQGSTGTFQTQLPLDGSGSYDLDGAVALYSWTQSVGPRVDLSDPTSPDPMFKQYEPAYYDVTYEFELRVSDGLDISAPDTVRFIVVGYGINPVPVGPRETQIHTASGSVPEVTQISGDPPATMSFPGVSVPGAGRLRAEVRGTPALFNGPDGNNPNFHLSSHGIQWGGLGTYGFHSTDIETAPVITNTYFDISAGGAATLTVVGPQALSYTFYDFLYGEAQSFNIYVWFRPASTRPTADPDAPATAQSGTVVQLGGLGSSDPEGMPLSYYWTQTSGPSGTISNPSAPCPLYKAPHVDQPTSVVFQLIVSDGQDSLPTTTALTVLPAPADTDVDGVLDSVESGAPNSGDGNDDGVADSQQDHVCSLPNRVDGQYVTLVTSDTLRLINVRAIDNPATDTMPAGTQCPVGFFSFGVIGAAPGATVTVVLILPSGISVNRYLKWGATPDNPSTHWYFFGRQGATGAQISGNRVTLYFIDSQRGDGDLRQNGLIADPGAPVVWTEASTRGWQLYR